ncbi:MAG: 50S ribosomal protein L19e [Nanoarchaeota archaeon]
MNLDKKKKLASRTLDVGKERIIFNTSRLTEIKEAITKQDIKDLYKDGAITIKDILGRKKVYKRKTRRNLGSRKKIIVNKKQVYVKITRRLRRYLKTLRNKENIDKEQFLKMRREIKTNVFKSLAQFKERLGALK